MPEYGGVLAFRNGDVYDPRGYLHTVVRVLLTLALPSAGTFPAVQTMVWIGKSLDELQML